jgi:hypothetical protein
MSREYENDLHDELPGLRDGLEQIILDLNSAGD